MGQTNSKGKKLIKRYWEEVAEQGIQLRVSQDNRKTREFFDCYDKEKKGVLTKEVAMLYISDLLKASGLHKKLLKEFKEREENKGIGTKEAYQVLLEKLFKEMDVNNTNCIEFSEIVKPDKKLLQFLRCVSEDAKEKLEEGENEEGGGESSSSSSSSSTSGAVPSSSTPSIPPKEVWEGDLEATAMDQKFIDHIVLHVLDNSDGKFNGHSTHRVMDFTVKLRFDGTRSGDSVTWTEIEVIEGAEAGVPCVYSGTVAGKAITGTWKNESPRASSNSKGEVTFRLVE